jgi:phosphate/sulfate permease
MSTQPTAQPPAVPGSLVTTASAITTTTSAPAPSAVSDVGSPWLTAALLAAVITAAVTLVLARRKHLEEERARVAVVFAEAAKAVAAYLEMPYAIRRRNHKQPEEERVRLSQEMSKLQADLSFYLAWTAAESTEVGLQYQELVTKLRQVAGTACHEAWEAAAPTSDAQMNIPPTVVDLSAVRPYQNSFTTAAQAHLDQYLSWRALLRRPRRQ